MRLVNWEPMTDSWMNGLTDVDESLGLEDGQARGSASAAGGSVESSGGYDDGVAGREDTVVA